MKARAPRDPAAPALTTPPRKAPVGLVLCSMALVLVGLVFLLTGILFLVSPESLREAGFRQDAALGIRVAGLLAFGGVAAMLAWTAWSLIRLGSLALEVTRALALATAGLFVTRIAGGGASSVFNWLVVVAAVAVAGYLTLPSVRVLFRLQSG
jgi:hypothetical protein